MSGCNVIPSPTHISCQQKKAVKYTKVCRWKKTHTHTHLSTVNKDRAAAFPCSVYELHALHERRIWNDKLLRVFPVQVEELDAETVTAFPDSVLHKVVA